VTYITVVWIIVLDICLLLLARDCQATTVLLQESACILCRRIKTIANL